jgi:CHAD domain-containing protein
MPTTKTPAEARSKKPRQAGRGNGAVVHAPASTCADAFRRLATACLAEIAVNQHAAGLGQVDAIHRMRVGITRLRAAVSFFAPMSIDRVWPRLKDELRWFNRALGSARDVDVVVENLRRRRYRKLTLVGIDQDLARRSKQTRTRLNKALRSARFRRFLALASTWIDRGPWSERTDARFVGLQDQPIGPFCAHRIAQWQKKLIRDGSELADMKEERRHRLRIRAKRLRYMLEMLATVCPERYLRPFGGMEKPIKRLQRTLGDLGDLKRLRDWTKSSYAARREHLPDGYKRAKSVVLADAGKAFRRMARATQQS